MSNDLSNDLLAQMLVNNVGKFALVQISVGKNLAPKKDTENPNA